MKFKQEIRPYRREEADGAVQAELKAIRKRLWRRSASIVAVSVMLAAGILLGVIYGVIPAAEKQYWNPETNTYGDQFSNDLELTLAAYSELFTEDVSVHDVRSERTGFAAHNLTIQSFHTALGGDSRYTYGSLVKGELSLPEDFMQPITLNIFERASFPEYPMNEEHKKSVRDSLEALPEYVKVYMAVSFPEDLTMEELIQFSDSLEGGNMGWAGIRNSPVKKQRYPLCGMTPFGNGVIREDINDAYPFFEIKEQERTPDSLEQHFISLLQYSADREAEGRGTGKTGEEYYREVLEYVEENGVKCYGCFITASPQTVLELLDGGIISQAWPMDALIDF